MRLRAKIALLLLLAAAVVLVVGLSRGRAPAPTTAPAPAPVTTVAPSTTTVAATPPPSSEPSTTSSPSSAPTSLTAEARRRWEPVVRGFGSTFTQAQWSRQRWQAALAPYSEAAVRTDLGTYDRKQVPDQRYVGYDVLDAQDADLAVQVNYSDGWAMVLYLHTGDQQRWLVHAYDRLEE